MEIYSEREQGFVWYQAIVDTGSDICVVAEHIRQALQLPLVDTVDHLWQMRDAVTLKSTRLRVRIAGETLGEVEAAVIEIPQMRLRPAFPEEFCTRPEGPHLLTERLVLGENLFNRLSESLREELGLR